MQTTETPKGGNLAKAALIAALALGGIFATYTVAFAADPTPTPSTAPSTPSTPANPGGATHDCPNM
ncbi:MAG TPA: hypothetical protein VFA01_02535 [Candidatus Dormibacteraeota bacterium]|nr:hypothetical protein [Candidatus Dormibacteraeota bacterium]